MRQPIRSAPKGNKVFLQNAVAYLGPFSDAVGQLSKLEARRRTEQLARSLNYNFTRELQSLRLGEMIDQFRKSVALATGLKRYLSSLSSETRFLLETDGQGIPGFTALEGKRAESGVQKRGQDLDKLIRELGVFAGHLALTTAIVEDRFKGVGRNINMHHKLEGIVRIRFIQEGLAVFEAFRPARLSGSIGGPFHNFLLQTFEYARGSDPDEEKAKLGTHLKRLVGAYKARRKEEANHAEIYARRETLRANPKTKTTALRKIDIELEKSGELMRKHWQTYMPQLRY